MSGIPGSLRWPPPLPSLAGIRDRWPAPTPRAPVEEVVLVPATPFQQALSVFLGTLSAAVVILLVNLVLLSPVQHFTSQHTLFDQFRLTLAEGSVPVGPVTNEGDLVEPGAPVAMMYSSVVGIRGEIIVQGTAGAQTMQGVGHRRDTVMPCQVGTSVLMARSGAYGGLGSLWSQLQPGDFVTITTGQGRCGYEVTGSRRAGDDAPPPPAEGEGSLVLTTGAGLPYLPGEVLRIDAELRSPAFEGAASALPSAALPETEKAMAADTSTSVLFGLILLLEVLIAAAIAVTWLWRRWGAWQTWIVAIPVLGALAVIISNSAIQLVLPNLL